MRGKVAKELRRVIYGDDYVTGVDGRGYVRGGNGQIMADDNRQHYQKAKKIWHTNRPLFKEGVANAVGV